MNTPGFQCRLKKVEHRSSELAVTIRGMRGASCAERIRQTVNSLPGIESVFVDVDLAHASIRFHPTVATPEIVKQAIRNAGYEAFDMIGCKHNS